MFLGKYGNLSLYDEYLKEIVIVDHEEIQFDTNYGWNLIRIPEEPFGYLSGNEFFLIHDDLFNRIKSTNRENNISLKII